MYKVLLVDDEPWIIFGLRNLIDWESYGYTIIGDANNGIRALEIIEKHKPDLVISDIRMPGLDGIQLMEEIMENKLDTKVILVSGYAEFAYAQKAIALGAFDYLLKQVEQDQLINVLKRLTIVLQGKSLNRIQVNNDDTLIISPLNKIKISDFVMKRNLGFDMPNYQLICCVLPHEQENKVDNTVVNSGNLNYVKVQIEANKLYILVNFDLNVNKSEPYHIILAEFPEATYVGISSICDSNRAISALYKETEVAINNEIFIQNDRRKAYRSTEKNNGLSSTLINIEKSIREHDLDHTNDYINEFYKECKEGQFVIDDILIFYNQIVTFLYKYYPKKSFLIGIEYCDNRKIIDFYESIEHFFDMIKMLFGNIDQSDRYISNDNIKKIMNDVNEKFTLDISLQLLSQKYNISMSYLSNLIKKETGHTYTEHIMNKRLDLAKAILKDNSMSIEEIAEKVGYNDYFHFTKVFKKNVGITPSKYRKLD